VGKFVATHTWLYKVSPLRIRTELISSILLPTASRIRGFFLRIFGSFIPKVQSKALILEL